MRRHPKNHIAKVAAERWPDKKLPFGAQSALASEFGYQRTMVRQLLVRLGYELDEKGPTLRQLEYINCVTALKQALGRVPTEAEVACALRIPASKAAGGRNMAMRYLETGVAVWRGDESRNGCTESA